MFKKWKARRKRKQDFYLKYLYGEMKDNSAEKYTETILKRMFGYCRGCMNPTLFENMRIGQWIDAETESRHMYIEYEPCGICGYEKHKKTIWSFKQFEFWTDEEIRSGLYKYLSEQYPDSFLEAIK